MSDQELEELMDLFRVVRDGNHTPEEMARFRTLWRKYQALQTT